MGPGIPNPMLWGSADPLDELGKIERSLRFRGSQWLSRSISVEGNRRTWTTRCLIKRAATGEGEITNIYFAGDALPGENTYLDFSADKLRSSYNHQTASLNYAHESAAKYRDMSAHMEIVVSVDTTNPTGQDRWRVFVDGRRIALSLDNIPPLNFNTAMSRVGSMLIGKNAGNIQYLKDYLSSFLLVDGKALGPDAFGQIHPRTGQWRPKSREAIRAAVAVGGGARNGWGADGFFLPFGPADFSGTTVYDRSQSDTDTTGNNWTLNNINVTTPGPTYDLMLDTPTNNFCTLNPLLANANINFSAGNLDALIGSSGSVYRAAGGTFQMVAGKWYFEDQFVTINTNGMCGVGSVTAGKATWESDVTLSSLFWLVGGGGSKINGSPSAYGAGFVNGDIARVAIDMDAGKIWFGKNGAWSAAGDPEAGLNPAFTNLLGKTVVPAFFGGAVEGGSQHSTNFGQRPFAYPPPAGFKALCTKNLPIRHPVMRSSDAFVAKTDSGANIKTALEAASPWDKWIRIYKRRDAAEGWRWQFWDDAANYLDSSSTAAKAALPALAGASYVGYALKVAAQNGVATGRLVHTSGVADTVLDGLSKSRKAVILVNEAGSNWFFYHPELTAGKLLYLNLTNAETTDATISAVTASGFTVAAALPSGTYRWISLAEVDGFLKLFKHTGNGLADGVFDDAGFDPEFLYVKCASAAGENHPVFDRARNSGNPVNNLSLMNLPDAELSGSSTNLADFVSSGAKFRGTGTNSNGSGRVYAGIMFAAFPFRYANAR